ncbi:Transcription initiation factor TFIID subunit 6 [Camellia lanceoleosa]|uniref:Transcription initiation factor TFIID subunit 6 n=1 Tax=Camellia lanceoleosa TaxID=1840588 RepID=A0ACC0ITP6_9ERIC|nr:Transcription initiation factor TFIID subunit 6 [Camellia lanceoleosa]
MGNKIAVTENLGGTEEAIKCMHHSKRTMLTTDDVDSALNLRNIVVIEVPLPKAPRDTSIVCHWLAIEGVQPAIPENAPVEVIAAPSENKKPEQKDDLPVDIKITC